MSRKVNMEKLLQKIAATVNADVNELKQAVEETKNHYSYDERVLQTQSVINFYRTRIAPSAPTQRTGETNIAFAKRKSEYENAYNEWRFKECKNCHNEFAYAYHYDGVAFCSLECLDAELRKIGLKVTIGRDLRRRWGLFHPAIVPPDALEALRQLPSPEQSTSDVPSQ